MSKEKRPLSVKNISKGVLAFGGKSCPKIQLEPGKEYSWPDEKSYAPYKAPITALHAAGMIQIGDKAPAVETPAKLEKELASKEAAAKSEQPVAAPAPDAVAEMNDAMAAAEKSEEAPAPKKPKPGKK
jgi:hypothetical protein